MSDTAAPILGPRELRQLADIDQRLLQLAGDLGAEVRQYPALIARQALERAEYPQAFPHLLLSAAPLRDPLAASQTPVDNNLGPVHWSLSPAVCYHVYAEHAGRSLTEGVTLTARGRCFRQEAELQPGVRQVEFEMREIVWLGSAAWVEGRLAEGRGLLTRLAEQLGLAGEWTAAEDPFFLPAAQGKAWMQRLQETKLEYQSREGAVALASVNRHRAFFGERFAIVDAQGESIHTACLAVGLDRWRSRLNPTRPS